MNPNDKAIEAGFDACTTNITRSIVRDIVTAAYAAQFPPSENYAELVKELRKWKDWAVKFNALSSLGIMRLAQAADALEALLAERDALKKALEAEQSTCIKVGNERAEALLERDALLARLAPVDDKALVEIAADAIDTPLPILTWEEREAGARAAIAAIRPHIEATERERCAKALEITSDEIRLHAGEMTAQEMRSVLAVLAWRAAAIRSGK